MAEERSKKGGFRGFLIFIVIVGAAVYAYAEFGGISFSDPLVRMVQLSNPPGESVRFVKSFRKFFASPEWESIVAEDGNDYVNFRGKAFYGDNIEEYALQFLIGEDKGVSFWKLTAIEVAGEPMPTLIFGNELMDKIYEEFR